MGRKGTDSFLHQFLNQFGKVKVLAISIDAGGLHEGRIMRHHIRQLAGGAQSWFSACGKSTSKVSENGILSILGDAFTFKKDCLQACQQPLSQGIFELFIPGFGVPAAFVFRLLDETDVGICLDTMDSFLDEFLVFARPMTRKLGDRCGAVAFKPGRLHFSCCHLSGQDNLERHVGPAPDQSHQLSPWLHLRAHSTPSSGSTRPKAS
jgi:hypothetical protein